MKRKISSTGLSARYLTIGKNDCGTRHETENFGQNAGDLVNKMIRIMGLLDIMEVPVSIFYDGELIFEGEAWEVKTLDQVKKLLPEGFKDSRQLYMEGRNQEVEKLDKGEQLASTFDCYKGDLLYPNEHWGYGHERPKGLDGMTWKSPYTISFIVCKKNTEYEWESPKYWTVVEEEELLDLKNRRESGLTAIVPHSIYTRSLDKLMLQQHGVGFGLDEQGRMVITWVD